MRGRVVCGAVAVAVLAGCPARPPARPSAIEPIAELIPQAELVHALAVRRGALHSLRALARLRITAPELSRSARQVIIAARPDRLRLEVLSPMGTVFVLTATDGSLAAYARDEARVYRGAASAKNLARYAQVDLPVATAVDLLLGTPPVRADRDGVVSRDDGHLQLWQADDGDVQVTWFGPGLEPVRYERRDGEGRVLLRATFGEYTEVGGVRVPTQLVFELPRSQRRIDIALRDPEVNPELSDAVFALRTPPGSVDVDLDQVVR